ncbi:MAG TPA: hypothetical protein VHI13_15330 [Candidatus Kapabacteria bacterium]|nr:hypothetical protein [Candidatus Kapabacteria bacterium]
MDFRSVAGSGMIGSLLGYGMQIAAPSSPSREGEGIARHGQGVAFIDQRGGGVAIDEPAAGRPGVGRSARRKGARGQDAWVSTHDACGYRLRGIQAHLSDSNCFVQCAKCTYTFCDVATNCIFVDKLTQRKKAMRQPLRTIALLLIPISIISCQQLHPLYNRVAGLWIIETISKNGRDVPLNRYLLNAIWFNHDGSIDLPVAHAATGPNHAEWTLKPYDKPATIIISGKDSIFSGRFIININDSNTMTLRSTSIRIRCVKSGLGDH